MAAVLASMSRVRFAGMVESAQRSLCCPIWNKLPDMACHFWLYSSALLLFISESFVW